MKLELRESNSQYWLIGTTKNKRLAGSDFNVACYYNSKKKQYELADAMMQKGKGIENVYLITGYEWDNMPSDGRESFGYLKNKGTLIKSTNTVTPYETKYGTKTECNYPKGVSRDPLPKKGAKVYTSPATALEKQEPKFKPELKEAAVSEDDMINMLQDILDQNNGYDINKTPTATGLYIVVLDIHGEKYWFKYDERGKACSEDYKRLLDTVNTTKTNIGEIRKSIITTDGTEDVLWQDYPDTKYEEAEVKTEAVPWKAIATGAMYAVDNWDTLKDMIETLKETSAEVYNKIITIFDYLKGKNANPKDAAKDIANMVAAEESLTEGATKLEKGEGSTFENAGTTWKVIKQNAEDTLVVALDKDGNEKDRYVVAWGLQKDNSWNQGHYFTDKDKAMKYFNEREKKQESLKESKIVTPVGNPQTAGSFVNIDVDLDHMEVSDFIVRLAQAIRSEQTAVLEYVALMSANGITNEDKLVIEGVMKEEKNHMCALTALLYKQILMNHKENVDEANDEFTLPKFGADIFDENNKLTESISTILNKIITESSHDGTNDEYTVGDRESARIYNGLSNTLNVIKNIISTSGEEVVVQNVTLSDDSKIVKESTMTIDDLINKLKTDTNYDEIAYHIHEYSKTDKNKAMELMDLLFELEDNKSPKECRDEIINHLMVTEAVNTTSKGDTFEITADVEYDSDNAQKVFDNLKRAANKLNKSNSEKYSIQVDSIKIQEGKLTFKLDNKSDSLSDDELEKIVNNLAKEASTYDAFIKIK